MCVYVYIHIPPFRRANSSDGEVELSAAVRR